MHTFIKYNQEKVLQTDEGEGFVNIENTAVKTCALAQGLRDFFSARGEEKRNAAWNSLAQQYGMAKDNLNVRELEYAFNRLFVGPQHIPAPPYASVYLDEEPLLMGKSTLEIRDLFRSLELAVPEGGEPDDFLAYELEAWLILVLCLKNEKDSKAREYILEALHWLTEEHMGKWLPFFLKKARQASDSAEIDLVLTALEEWLRNSLQRSVYEKVGTCF